jgi:hypothetical protein
MTDHPIAAICYPLQIGRATLYRCGLAGPNPAWFADYNSVVPHSALRYRPLTEYRRLQAEILQATTAARSARAHCPPEAVSRTGGQSRRPSIGACLLRGRYREIVVEAVSVDDAWMAVQTCLRSFSVTQTCHFENPSSCVVRTVSVH